MESLKSVARKTGYSYDSFLRYVKRYEKELVDKGVLVVKESLALKRYYVPDPEKFVETLKKLVREERK